MKQKLFKGYSMNNKILVLAQHNNQSLHESTLNTIQAATQLSDDITLLVAGFECESVSQEAACVENIKEVWVADDIAFQHGLAENIAELMVSLTSESSTSQTAEVSATSQFQYILAPASTYGKNILPRVAAKLEVAQISDVIQIKTPDTFVRPIYAGNALQTVQSLDSIKVLTIRSTAFEPVKIQKDQNNKKPIIKIDKIKLNKAYDAFDLKLSQFIKAESSVSERPDLSRARIVVSGGRGMLSRDNFKMIEDIADILGAAIGASRAAVDEGFISNDHQVGQTGKVVAPDLYIAVGISGAIQHVAGMKDSKIIVAINKDPDAPIFQIADYGLVGDLFQILPELKNELKK